MSLVISSAEDRHGKLYGHLTDQTVTRTPRGLFWNFSLPCAPIFWQLEEWECEVQCEWVQWSIRDWTGLDGATLGTSSDPASVQCSVYFTAHHPARLDSLSIKRVANTTRFEIELSGSFDLHGYGELDATCIPLALRGEVDFDGIVVIPGNVFPKPSAPSEVIRLVEPYLNLSNLGEPEWDRFRYVLKAGPPQT